MPYYHLSKQAALDYGDEKFGQDWCVRAQLEPGNGYVIVLSPKTLAYLKEPLEPLLDEAEIQITHTIRRRPGEFKPLPKITSEGNSERAERRRRRREGRAVPPPAAPPPPPVARPAAQPVAAAPLSPPPPPPRR